MTTESTELVRPDRRLSDDELAKIGSATDAADLLSEYGYTPEDFAETYGTGFKVLDTKDKGQLVGVDIVILEWAFNDGEQGPFVSCALVAVETGAKLILNDGSTGVLRDMQRVTDSRLGRGATHDQATHGLRVRGGLRRSDYPVAKDGTPLTKDEIREHPELKDGMGTTFYLAN